MRPSSKSKVAAAAIVKRCGCGAAYDLQSWERLTRVGFQVGVSEDGRSVPVELRNCTCGSTITVPIPAHALVALCREGLALDASGRSAVRTLIDVLEERANVAPTFIGEDGQRFPAGTVIVNDHEKHIVHYPNGSMVRKPSLRLFRPGAYKAIVRVYYFKPSGKWYTEDDDQEWPSDPDHYTGWAPFERVVRLREMFAVCLESPLGFPQFCRPQGGVAT